MKNTIFLALVCAAVIFSSACEKAGPTSTRPSTHEEISITLDLSQGRVVEPGRVWMDNFGIQHIRDRVTAGEIIRGDLVGTLVRTVVKNAKLELATGNGEALLSVESELRWPSRNLSGVFAGELSQQFTAFSRTASKLDAQGQQGFAGMYLNVSFKEKEAGVLLGKGLIYTR